ncbi:hypothetical protein ACYZT8_11185 [Pseudomonas sp. LB3P93]
MPFANLQNVIKRAGFTVIEFSDQRAFFGCWSLAVEGHGTTYLFVNEGREGWMMFYRASTVGALTELDKKESAWMDDTDKAAQCLTWLSDFRVPQNDKIPKKQKK